jgi:hypothetical protein
MGIKVNTLNISNADKDFSKLASFKQRTISETFLCLYFANIPYVKYGSGTSNDRVDALTWCDTIDSLIIPAEFLNVDVINKRFSELNIPRLKLSRVYYIFFANSDDALLFKLTWC